MSTPIDPAKLKVVELRQELSVRGLDTKGNKPVLVKRLKDALEKELEQEIPDTSIADTSTEDFNVSQTEDKDEPIESSQQDTDVKTQEAEPAKVEAVADEVVGKVEENPVEVTDKLEEETQKEEAPSDVTKVEELPKCDAENRDKVEENGEQEEPPSKKSRLDENTDNDKSQDAVADKTVVEAENEGQGEKRKHSSPPPNRSQRKRSKSPIKEDEPVIDNDKVQLNWYDSDLHLQVDKESFLSARPYHDGAFGYVWAGVRATHGADSGKVCFEIKITEELKWEDNIKPPERSRRDRDRKDSKRDKEKKLENDDKKKDKGEKKQQPNGDGSKEQEADAESKTETAAESKAETATESKTETDTESKTETAAEPKTETAAEPNTETAAEQKTETAAEPKTETEESLAEAKSEEEKKEATSTDAKPEDQSQAPSESEAQEKMEIDAKPQEEMMDVDEATKPKPEVKEKELPPIPSHMIRIGWSALNTSLQLGEDKFSYAFESTGKFVTDKQFSEYGKQFSIGDVIGAFVDLGADFVRFIFTINGEQLPDALSIPRAELPDDFSLFPHILSRNYVFEINLGDREEPWFANPQELTNFVFVGKHEKKILGPLRPENRSDCEVIMMCGLPASGKTHWVREYVKENTEKSYTIIGASQLLERMTVNGNPLKSNLRGRWNVLLDRLTKALNKLVEIAALRRRNYIIDQTNVFPSAQRRKMRSFEGFKRRAVIVVCGEEEQAKRRALQEAQDGKDVPDVAVLEMKGNMSLPRVGDWLQEVTYVELNEEEAKAAVQKYNNQGKEAGYGPTTQRRDYRDDRFRQGNRRNEYRGNYNRDRGYNRFDRGSSKFGGGWQNRSWSRNDRRDNRGPIGGGPRDFRNRGSVLRHQDRGRDRDSSRHGNRDTYNRNRNQGGGNRSHGNNWQSGGGGGGGNWNQSSWSSWQGQGGSWGGQGWSQAQGQGKWNYGQGYGQQSYSNYPNWNYYGQYQNWNTQQSQQPQAVASGTAAANSGSAQAWAQYAQQYAQSQQPTGQK